MSIGLTSADENGAGIVGETGQVSTHNGLKNSRVLLCSHAVGVLGLVGPDLGGVVKGLGKDVSRIVDVAGSTVALDNSRSSHGGSIDVVIGGVSGTVGLGSCAVVERSLRGKGKGQVAEGLVQLHDLGTVGLLRVLAGEASVVGNVTRGKAGVQITDIELVLLSNLDGELGDGDTAKGSQLGRNTGDSVHQNVS